MSMRVTFPLECVENRNVAISGVTNYVSCDIYIIMRLFCLLKILRYRHSAVTEFSLFFLTLKKPHFEFPARCKNQNKH